MRELAQPGWPSNDLHARSVGGFHSPYQYPIATKELVPGVKRDLSNQFRLAVAGNARTDSQWGPINIVILHMSDSLFERAENKKGEGTHAWVVVGW